MASKACTGRKGGCRSAGRTGGDCAGLYRAAVVFKEQNAAPGRDGDALQAVRELLHQEPERVFRCRMGSGR